ncbi:DUF4123 domain-containing protein [Thioclava sp. GXIMD4216]|uniref:DUF4123 domain-containing protein n=1 Tax=Thioclava sp. GXIMD4216 TaxID=3131929 RepID=UPI0030CF6168
MESDFWLNIGAAPQAGSDLAALLIETLSGVVPLGRQFGKWPKQTVPDGLAGPLFGDVAPDAAEIATYGAAEQVPSMRTYAILDAAKAPYLLTGLLDQADLMFQSLFQGSAAEELEECAPYLVELQKGHDFTRHLMTRLDDGVGLWDQELGIYVRSRASFDDLRRHFRKFTRLQDYHGQWFYFRFWEPELLRSIVRTGEGLDLLSRLLDVNQLMVCDPILAQVLIVSGNVNETERFRSRPAVLTERTLLALQEQRRRSFSRKVACEIAANEGGNPADSLEDVYCAVLRGMAAGLRSDIHIKRFVEISRHASRYAPAWQDVPEIRRTLNAGHAPAALLIELEYDLVEFAGVNFE